MALLKKILKNDPRDVIVKWTGNGADTLTLASLVSAGQTVTGTVPAGVHIVAVSSSVSGGGDCTITRNGEVTLHTHDNFEFQTDGIIQAVLSENQGSDIAVNLANTGTLILKLRKIQGYSEIVL
jgi:hypothetical protein